MPLLRYFLFAGGSLLALLVISDAYLPKSPVPESAAADLPTIRIRSDRKWPERIVYDTSISAVQTAKAELPVAASAEVAEVAARARMREAFAMLPTSAQPPEPKQIVPSEPAKPQAKPQLKRKVARRRPAPPMVLVAQQPQFGFFANSTW